MRNLLERIRFKLRFARDFPFSYDHSTGSGMKPLRYSILSDLVWVRYSQFGTSSLADLSGRPMSREDFEHVYRAREARIDPAPVVLEGF